MSSNPYQGFFDKLDKVLADDTLTSDARDVLTRAGFVLGNLLNAQAQLYPHLFIDPELETVPGETTEDASGTAPEQPGRPEATP